MSWITKVALKKRWLTLLIAALFTGASIWAIFTMKMELFPDIDLPMTTVITIYPQAQPDEVMEKVTIPIEDATSNIPELRHTSSTSSRGRSFVFLQFEYGTDMDKANQTIADNLEKLDFPAEVTNLGATVPGLSANPQVIPINMNMIPVVTLNLGGDVPVEELKQIADEQILPRLSQIEGVFDISVTGGSGVKVLVSPDLDSLTQHGVSMGHLAAALASEEFQSLESVEDTILRPDGLVLSQVADVSAGLAPGTSISRTNGKPSISINISKEASANTVTTANAVLDEAESISKGLPAGMELVTILDQSEYIEASVSDLTNNALLGSALAIVVVFFFLMAFRASLVTAISIPLSILLGFLVMRFTGITINILTLSAMIIAVGRVIDNSIVILEVVYRRMQHGERFTEAAINGVREVVTPITSATIATVVIFLPLVFVGGIVGEMFIPFGLTLTFALVGSLLVALTIVPALSGYLLKPKTQAELKSSWYLRGYTTTLKWCLGHRAATLIIAVLLFLGSFILLPIIGTTFMPEMNSNVLNVGIEMPAGTDIIAVTEVAAKVETVLDTHPEIISYNTVAGPSAAAGGSMAAAFGGNGVSNFASIRINTAPGTNTEELTENLNKEFIGLSDTAIISVDALTAMSGGMATGLEISVLGNSRDDVSLAAQQLLVKLENPSEGEDQTNLSTPLGGRMKAAQEKALASLTDLKVKLDPVEPTLNVEPDLAKVMALGLGMEQMSLLQKEFLIIQQGTSVAQVTLDGIPRDVFLEGIVEQFTDTETASELKVGFPEQVTLGDIATVSLGEQVTKISRSDGKISATITAEIKDENVGAVTRAVQGKIDTMDLPPGVEISMGGISEDMRDSFSSMFVAIGIAMVLAYAVLVVTFRSFRNPLIIMVSLPLASIGALVGLFATGRSLGVTGLMGTLMLVGIVLTNAVVLVAVVEQLRKSGMNPYDALVEGARTRLRPVLMTALTTMSAMLPLALGLGEGVMMAAELATVVIGGLFSSTVLTLLVLPAVYATVYRIRKSVAISSAGTADKGADGQ